jgi:hypothetical protein
MPYNFLFVMAAQKLMPDTGPDLLADDPFKPKQRPAPVAIVDPPFDPAPQPSVTRFGVEQAGRSQMPDEGPEQ